MLEFAVEMVGLRCVVEEVRHHPRDFFGAGRVKVELFKDGKPVISSITNKRQLYAAVANKISEAQEKFDKILKQQKDEIEKRNAEMAKMRQQQTGQTENASAEGANESSSSKKNKKKKKK